MCAATMETDSGQDFQDFWEEFKLQGHTDPDEDDFGRRSSGSASGSGEDDADVDVDGDVDGEQEADWLEAAGLAQLTGPFRAGRELGDAALEPALRLLPRHQAEAVRRRVRSLNRTVRQRGGRRAPGGVRGRQRHPDIRDVFRDVMNAQSRDVDGSSTGTRSRSATPDSLDSAEEAGASASSVQGSPPTDGGPTPPPSLVQLFNPSRGNGSSGPPLGHKAVRRIPSAPSSVLPVHELFRGAYRGTLFGGDIVASECIEGIEMLNYQRIGSMHLSKYRGRGRLGLDQFQPSPLDPAQAQSHLFSSSSSSTPSSNPDLSVDLEPSLEQELLVPHAHASVTRSQSTVFKREAQREEETSMPGRKRSGSQGHLSFEQVCRQQQQSSTGSLDMLVDNENFPLCGRTWVEFLGDSDQQKLSSLLLLEVTALFDSCGLRFNKRKPSKRKRREEGNVFGVSLSTLLERDQQVMKESSKVPLFVQKLVNHLERRALGEEGILRVAAHHVKVNALTHKLEELFYTRPDEADKVLDSASPHELAALLKKWLRDLPQPLVTPELVSLFYRTHELPENLCSKALNLLVLLLPPENRATLRLLIEFLNHVVDNQDHNKMSLHNVAMIAAPSLLPPRYVEGGASHSSDKSSLNSQVNLAAVCCQISETLMRTGDALWVVPQSLVNQVRKQNEQERVRRAKDSKPIKRFLGLGNITNTPAAETSVEGLSAGVLRISAPQFGLNDFPLTCTEATTAGNVVLCLVDAASRDPDAALDAVRGPGRGNGQRRPHSIYQNGANSVNATATTTSAPHGRAGGLQELAHNANLSCLLATADTELALRTHYLYEVGGNIGERQLEHSALISAVMQENLGASLVLRCHHRNGNNPLLNTSQ